MDKCETKFRLLPNPSSIAAITIQTQTGKAEENRYFHPGSINTAALRDDLFNNSLSHPKEELRRFGSLEQPKKVESLSPWTKIVHSAPAAVPFQSNVKSFDIYSSNSVEGSQITLENGNKVVLLSKQSSINALASNVLQARGVYAVRLSKHLILPRSRQIERLNNSLLLSEFQTTRHALSWEAELEMIPAAALDSSLILTSVEANSPFPLVSYSPIDQTFNIKQFQLQNVMEELFESERSYLVSIRLFRRSYIQLLIQFNRNEVPIPLEWINEYLCELELHHAKFIAVMECIFKSPSTINNLAVAISNAVGDFAINVRLYGDYCNSYEDVVNLINKGAGHLNLNNTWIKGWETYLEVSQPINHRMDLSFMSLIQKPISRLGKYRLILEAMVKHIERDRETIQSNLNKVKVSLTAINANSSDFKDSDKTQKISNLVSLKGVRFDNKDSGEESNISVQFFGKCLLVSSLNVVWIDDEKHRSSHYGALLFKSHLLLLDLKKPKWSSGSTYGGYGHERQCEPIFIVPLCKCKLVEATEEFEGGLYSCYPCTIKLTFENCHCHFEILLIFLAKLEHCIWREYLTSFVNVVNGPCKMSYESDGLKYLIKYPQTMNPCDISLIYYNRYKDRCYFGESKSIKVQLNLNENDKESTDAKDDRTKLLMAPYFNSLDKYRGDEVTVIIRRSERLQAESILAEVWSEEVPRFFDEKVVPTIKKSSSWSTMRRNTFGSLRRTSSCHNVWSPGSSGISTTSIKLTGNLNEGGSFDNFAPNSLGTAEMGRSQLDTQLQQQEEPQVDKTKEREIHRTGSRSRRFKTFWRSFHTN